MFQTLHADPGAVIYIAGCMEHLLAVKELQSAERRQQQQLLLQPTPADTVTIDELEVRAPAAVVICSNWWRPQRCGHAHESLSVTASA
jgi:hypothetical protein